MKSSYVIILVGILFVVLIVTAFFRRDTPTHEKPAQTGILQASVTPSTTASPTPISITKEEQDMIDQWIKKNNLNQFGDPKETMYAGGSPLFQEASGSKINRYVYIKQKHPEMPWKL